MYQFEKLASEEIEIPLDAPFSFETATTKTKVDFKTGNIETRFLKEASSAASLEIESNLAVVFGVALLHVVLQPKPGPYSNARKSIDAISQINPYYSSTNGMSGSLAAMAVSGSTRSISANSTKMNSYKLYSCIGYIDLIYLDSFFNQCCKISHHESNRETNKKLSGKNNTQREEIENYNHWFPDAFVNFLNGGR